MSRQILVVEDNELNRRLLYEILQADYAVLEAVNGKEALKTLKADPSSISAVLLDITMPVMDGYAVLEAMRDDQALSLIPVIVTTATEDSEAEKKALELGAVDFVTKPFDGYIIKHRLANAIKAHELAERLQTVVSNVASGVAAYTFRDGMQGEALLETDRYFELLGYTREQFAEEVKNPFDIVVPDDVEELHAKVMEIRRTGKATTLRFRVKRRDGREIWLQDNVTITTFAGIDEPVQLNVFTDITEPVCLIEKENMVLEALRVSEEEYRLAIEHSGRFIYRYDHAEDTVTTTENVAAFLGILPRAQCNIDDIIAQANLAEVSKELYREFLASIKRGDETGKVTVQRKIATGEWRWFEGTFFTILDDAKRPRSAIAVFADITDEREERLLTADKLKQAELDGMTGIYNRAVAEKLIKKRLLEAEDDPCALLIVDLDDLKCLNDSMGHAEGDRAIVQLARQLREQFRHTDIVGRAGGDEFIVFLQGVTEELLNSMLSEFMHKVSMLRVGEQDEYSISCSMGIAIGSSLDSYGDLFKKADKALYFNKRNSKGKFAFYRPEMG